MKEVKTIYKWIIAVIGFIGVFSGAYYVIKQYGADKEILKQVIFTSPDIRLETERHINSGYSETKNLDALNKLTDRYKGLTTSIDTLYKMYIFVNSDIEVNRLRNEAILNLVHRMDSIMSLLDERQKEMIKNIQSGRNASELNLIEIRRLKALENFNGD